MQFFKNLAFSVALAACVLSCTDRKKFAAEKSAQLYSRTQDLLKTCKEETKYPQKAEIGKLSGRGFDPTFTKAELEAWLKLLPTKEYYDKVSTIIPRCNAQYDQVVNEMYAATDRKDKLMEVYARIGKQGFFISLGGQVSMLGVDFFRASRLLEQPQLWTEQSKSVLSAKVKEYLCSVSQNAIGVKFKLGILNYDKIAALLGSKFDTTDTEKTLAQFRVKADEIFGAKEPECSKFVSFFSDRCLIDSIEKQMDIWDQENALVREFDAKLATSVCGNAENIK